MNKPLVVLALLWSFAATHAHAQMNPNPLGLQRSAATDPSGSNVAEVRFGGGTVGGLFGSGSGPVLTGLFERRVSEALSLGLLLSHATTKYSVFDSFSGEYGYKASHNTLAGRATYHVAGLVDDERVDLFAGGQLGYTAFSISAFGPSVQQSIGKTSYMVMGGFTGGRFWFKPNLGVSAEVGYHYALYNELGYAGLGWSSASAGLSFRF
jgi:hypothetical protein